MSKVVNTVVKAATFGLVDLEPPEIEMPEQPNLAAQEAAMAAQAEEEAQRKAQQRGRKTGSDILTSPLGAPSQATAMKKLGG